MSGLLTNNYQVSLQPCLRGWCYVPFVTDTKIEVLSFKINLLDERAKYFSQLVHSCKCALMYCVRVFIR